MKDYFLDSEGNILPSEQVKKTWDSLCAQREKTKKILEKKLKLITILAIILLIVCLSVKYTLLIPLEWRLIWVSFSGLVCTFLFFLFRHIAETEI